MYCKNCGNPVDDNAAVCTKCGYSTGTVVTRTYCPSCGQVIAPGTAVCSICGTALPNSQAGSKSKLAAGLLGIFLGAFGVHNFYLGFTGKAIGQLLITLLSCGTLSFVSGIWGLIEGILYLAGSSNTDAAGNPLRN